jgi:hypothetical protein
LSYVRYKFRGARARAKCVNHLMRVLVVGAKGFEPSTSWSRTKYLNPINAVSGVAYGARNVISPLLVVRNLSVDLSVILRAR